MFMSYTAIIFSDHELCEKQGYVTAGSYQTTQFVKSQFDQALAPDTFVNTPNLTHLVFGFNYDQPLGTSLYPLTSLTHLTFGHRFNHPLSTSLHNLKSLTHLTFGICFNRPLGTSLHNLKSLNAFDTQLLIQQTIR